MSNEETHPTDETAASEDHPVAGADVTEPQEAAVTKPQDNDADVQALRQELETQRELANRNLDQWKRAAADLQNYRKRMEKERSELVKFGPAVLMKTLLPILDDFERALQTCPDPCYRLTWTEGIALIDRKLQVVLEQQGLREIEALGKPFDPASHEVFLEEESTTYPDGHVSAVLQKGYLLHERVLRPAVVKVARKAQAEQAGPVAAEQTKHESESELNACEQADK